MTAQDENGEAVDVKIPRKVIVWILAALLGGAGVSQVGSRVIGGDCQAVSARLDTHEAVQREQFKNILEKLEKIERKIDRGR